MLYIPNGFAHGFVVLSDEAELIYKTSSEYAPQADRGVLWSDKTINIDWEIDFEPILSEKDKLQPKLNNITKEDFDRSLVWYTRYPKELAKIYKRLSNRVNDEYNLAARSLSQIEKKSFTIQSGDSVNLWYLDRTALLNNSVYMNKLTYRINSDTTFHKGDTVRLNIHGTFVSVDSCVPNYAYVSLSAYYGDGVSTSDTILESSGQMSLSLILDTNRALSSISGSINYLDSTDNRQSILVLSGIEMIRYHEKELKKQTGISLADSTGVSLSPAEL